MLHRVRDHFIRRRTGAVNALRGHLAEFGVVAASQRAGLNRLLELIEATDDRLPAECIELLGMITAEIRGYDAAIAKLDGKLRAKARDDATARRLMAVPGIGPIIATAIPAHMSAGGAFPSGRSFAAWLGLTPRQHSSGGKERTYGISKRGNSYLRRQLINGARAIVRVAKGRRGGIWDWVNRLLKRRHFNVVTAAVAAKLARIMWAMINRNTAWRAT
jgi:transposase